MSPSETITALTARPRLGAIDALRGMAMLFMLVDHVRETFYLHQQVTDPMNAALVDPALFFTRLTSQVCAPAFIGLTGLSAYLYGLSHGKAETSAFLLRRGLFLILLELTVVGFAWSAQFPPQTFWLQVIWCIGWCMIALAGLLHLPRPALAAVGIAVVAGHNLLDGVRLTAESAWYPLWAVLHQRAVVELGAGMAAKTTYPILPWIGVIVLGYCLGPWFASGSDANRRRRDLIRTGSGLILAFLLLRAANFYGDQPWNEQSTALRTVMSFLSLTKYPPSLLFLLPTLGLALLLLALFERFESGKAVAPLAAIGGAPMFFYLLHLYVLKSLYLVSQAIWGTNQGAYFGFDHVAPIWLASALLTAALFFPTGWFARLKRRRRDLAWLSYL